MSLQGEHDDIDDNDDDDDIDDNDDDDDDYSLCEVNALLHVVACL